MYQIEVDFDVFKAITARRPSEAVTANDILRQLLGLPAAAAERGVSRDGQRSTADDWVTKGVRLPVGTEFRASYKGQLHLARVAHGGLMMGGREFASPSAAAMAITGYNVNGWRFWQCRVPGESQWRSLESLKGAAKRQP